MDYRFTAATKLYLIMSTLTVPFPVSSPAEKCMQPYVNGVSRSAPWVAMRKTDRKRRTRSAVLVSTWPVFVQLAAMTDMYEMSR